MSKDRFHIPSALRRKAKRERKEEMLRRRAIRQAPALARDAEHARKREHYRRTGEGSECDASWYDNFWAVTREREDDPSSPVADPMYYPSWKKVISWLSSEEVVIDLGCGAGGFAKMAIEAGIHYLGVDFSEKAIEWARERNPEHLSCFMTYDILKPEVMTLIHPDTIVILETLEHLDGDLQVLANIPEGTRVILSVPSYGGRSHVRYFGTLEEAVVRYSQVLDITQTEEVVIGANGQTLWLIDGVRKGSRDDG